MAIVTGATSGIGKAMTKELSKAGFHLVIRTRPRRVRHSCAAAARNMAKAERVQKEITAYSGNPAVTLIACDLARLSHVRRFAADFCALKLPLHLLISTHPLSCAARAVVDNAGGASSAAEPTEDGLEPTMGANYVSHVVLLDELRPLIEASRDSSYGLRIINVGSAAYFSVDRVGEGDFYGRSPFETLLSAYSRSKFAMVEYSAALAKTFASPRVTVNSMEPGLVRTDIQRDQRLGAAAVRLLDPVLRYIMLGPEEGAITALWMALSPEFKGVTGRFFSDLGEYVIAPRQPGLLALTDTVLAKLEPAS